MIPLLEVLKRTEGFLRDKGIPTPRLDAELLLAHVLNTERLGLYLRFDQPMKDEELEALRPLVRRRAAREPLAWITGHKGFHRVDLIVRPGVLVPRPDTETLVDAALEWIGRTDEPVYVADVGCGSGAVGLAIAHSIPGARVYAIDLSPDALATTRDNVAALGLADRVGVLEGSLLDPVPARRPIDWVVSNPPYIRSREIDRLEPEVSRHEPRLALDGGLDGLAVYRQLIPMARARARAGILLELGHDQADAVLALLDAGGFVGLHDWKDLGGHRRVVGGKIPTAG